MIHNKRHVGIASDMVTVRLDYWIVGLRKICADIKNKCIICRKLCGKFVSQKMGLLPIERLKPSPAWNSTGIDLFGPFEIKGEVNKRSTGKVYGVIFFCLPSTAIHLDITSDYSTDAFLNAFRRFVSIRGCPSVVYSDAGSQLLGASKVLRNIAENWDWDKISHFHNKKGIKWNFSPGDAPWWNGCCEALIRSVKKSIHLALGESRVTFSELQTANLVHERPIGIKPGNYSEYSYLCPNDLILGRATSSVPSGPWDDKRNITKRFRFIQSIVDLFWDKWTLCYFPHLITEPKWNQEQRNLRIGDIVLISEKHIPRGQWKLGKISKVEPGDDDKVRRVHIQYRNKSDSSLITVERPVQRLIVILPAEEQVHDTIA